MACQKQNGDLLLGRVSEMEFAFVHSSEIVMDKANRQSAIAFNSPTVLDPA
jgi:hypothetical protein